MFTTLRIFNLLVATDQWTRYPFAALAPIARARSIDNDEENIQAESGKHAVMGISPQIEMQWLVAFSCMLTARLCREMREKLERTAQPTPCTQVFGRPEIAENVSEPSAGGSLPGDGKRGFSDTDTGVAVDREIVVKTQDDKLLNPSPLRLLTQIRKRKHDLEERNAHARFTL